MSGCLDRVRCGCDCDCLEPVKEWLRPKRNMFASVIAGTLVREHSRLTKLVVTPFFSVFPWLVGSD